jgi:serine-type D-Ala-D-Ala carboxypeptidase/endopeptidase (penicillin-binding protein 4)
MMRHPRMAALRRSLVAAFVVSATFHAWHAHAQIPASVQEVYDRAQVPRDAVSLVVKEVGAATPLVSVNADRAMNPASVMKLVTTYAALELLGPAHTWKTDVLVTADIRNASLTGDLVLKGSGDPKLTVERLWLLVKQLRERGLKHITGDLVLDKTTFGSVDIDPAKFDGESMRAYNVGPDAMLVNFKTVRFQFAPSFDGRSVAIAPDIKPVQLDVVNRVKLIDAACGDWRERIKLDVQQPNADGTELRVSFTGSYPKSCGERSWNVALLDHARFTGGAFAQLWNEAGGTWKGAVRVVSAGSPVVTDAKLILSVESPPLSEVARDVNKFSNNVMARQVFLSLSAEIDKLPATAARSSEIVRAWLARKFIPARELVLENGSGLSRIERISGGSLAKMLEAAFESSVMPEFISSLSLVGLDGTFRRRARTDIAAGVAHMKSGTLNDVRAIAGYVLANDKRRYIVVMMANHNNAIFTERAQDELLKWVYAREPMTLGPPPP